MTNFYGIASSSLTSREQALKSIIDQASRELGAIQMAQYPTIQQPIQDINNTFKFVNGIEDVNKEIVLSETLFISNDYKNLWIKNTTGKIRTFLLDEVIEKDEKDLKIEELQKEINEMKKVINNGNTKYDRPNGHSKNDDGSLSDQSSVIQSSSAGISKKR